MKNFRHEHKYICSDLELEIIKSKIESVAKKDKNTGSKDYYFIRSIYFDDLNNTAYFDNESGVNHRCKWRIRSYDCSCESIFLEKKEKINEMTHKESIQISLEEYKQLISGNFEWKNNSPTLLNLFKIECRNKYLRPVVIVEYTRTPFVYSDGNVRVTFDCNISSSTDFNNFFNKELIKRPIQKHYQQLLEVKYDELLPDTIYQCIQLYDMNRVAFSKYYLCRKFCY